jgi:hypothetical protein
MATKKFAKQDSDSSNKDLEVLGKLLRVQIIELLLYLSNFLNG